MQLICICLLVLIAQHVALDILKEDKVSEALRRKSKLSYTAAKEGAVLPEDADEDDYVVEVEEEEEEEEGDDEYGYEYEDDDDYYGEEEEEEEEVAIVYSWHSARKIPKHRKKELQGVEVNDYRWRQHQEIEIGMGNEFYVSVTSVLDAYPDMLVYLFTNVPEAVDARIRDMVEIVEVDLMEEADLYTVMAREMDQKVGFGTKPMALIYGWEENILPPRVLYLDIDTILLTSSTSDMSLYSVFDALDFYHMAAVYEGYALGPRPTPAGGIPGWEVNTGVLAIHESALPFLNTWLDTFILGQKQFKQYLSGEQSAFMVALERSPRFRVYPLPPIFNWRRTALLSITGPNSPTIVQAHIFQNRSANPKQYKEWAKQSAVVMMRDCLSHMDGSERHIYLCDVMTG